MNTNTICLFFLTLFFPLQTHALILTSITENVSIPVGIHRISTDASAMGYNPETDELTRIELTLDFREIIEDGDDWEAGTNEFVSFYTTFFGIRHFVYSDVDTERFFFVRDWFYPDDCVDSPWNDCSQHPIITGLYYIALEVGTNNLQIDQVRWDIHVNRTPVDESSSAILLMFGILMLVAMRVRTSN